MIRYRLEGLGVNEIAERMSLNPSSVSRTLAEPEVRAEIDRQRRSMIDDIRDGWAMVQRRAWRTMVALLDSEDESIRYRAADNILDRGPMVKGASVTLDASVSVSAQLEGLTVAQLRALAGEDEGPIVLDVPHGEAK